MDSELSAPTDPDDGRVLHQIIRTISSSLELEETLRSVVALIAEGSHSLACFLWIIEGDGRLVLRAASEQYQDTVGLTALARGEGVAGWVAEHGETVFLAEDAISDPRFRYFPEFEEEKFQSLLSLPLRGREGDIFGVVGIHSRAPRRLSAEDARFMAGAASLVAGAIENARLHTATRTRMEALERIGELSIRTASAATSEELVAAVAETARALLEADQVEVLPGSALTLGEAPPGTIEVPLQVDGDVLGKLVASRTSGIAFGAAARDLALGLAAQAAVGLKKIELIERVTERALLRELFDGLTLGRSEAVHHARRFGLDLREEHFALEVHPWRPVERSEQARLDAAERFGEIAEATLPGSLLEREGEALRAIVPSSVDVVARLREAVQADPRRLPVVVGVSESFVGGRRAQTALRAAALAARVAPISLGRPGVLPFAELGALRYLVHVPVDDGEPDRYRDAVQALREHDRRRGTALVRTLEELLARRGNVGSTSEALYVHPNTLRQRLARMRAVSGLELADEDWLALQIVLRLERLRDSLAPARFDPR